ncbi:MAG: bifunctional hydroxymethylpyrimidine kinase/phosphomethylpyrimidine kinase [Bacteroides sp.]|nr:bifunctional hydroxymethylpyrimidine kinase/phosphomethylpyrimidine kinase [Bacteroides sp.]
MRHYHTVLSIAGSDCSGGAGIQADIKTISALGCYAMTAITAITAQNTTGVGGVEPISPEMVEAQIEAVFADIRPMAVKTGMLYDASCVKVVAKALARHKAGNIVVDPVMVSTSGAPLIEPEAIEAIKSQLFPIAALITPNRNEAIWLTGETDPERQADVLHAMGCRNVLLKGGDSDRTDVKIDYLSIVGTGLTPLHADAVDTRNSHGTGCTLSSAIASYLALGHSIDDAVARGKLYVTRALQAGAFVSCGKGHGPVNHFFSPRRLKTFNPNTTEHDN